MAYLFRQKLNISDLTGFSEKRKKILIYEPENYLYALYEHYLRSHNFDIKHCPELSQLKPALNNFSPHLLIFNLDAFTSGPFKLNIKESFPELTIITIGHGLENQTLKQLMS